MLSSMFTKMELCDIMEEIWTAVSILAVIIIGFWIIAWTETKK